MKTIVDRYIYPTEGRIDISHEGFLILTDYTFRYSDIVEVSELSGGILLGEGGMGKTTFLKKLCRDAPAKSSMVFELGHYRNDPQGLREDVKQFQSSLPEGMSPTYIFDGYDEAPELNASVARLIPNLGEDAKIWVGSRDIPAIRAIQEERKEFKAYKLAPLTVDDIRSIAAENEIDADDFIQKIREKGITQICAKPLGCEFAVSAYCENKLQIHGAYDLWGLGIRRLCDETPSITKRLSADQGIPLDCIYQRASWIALCLELTRNSSIWTGEASHCPAGSLLIENLMFNDLTLEVIQESLHRGVFTPIGDGRVQFAKSEYQDFLSADRFKQSIPEVAWEPLLMTSDRSGVYPDRHQIAAWLTDSPDILELLLHTQPQLLIRNETAVLVIGADTICRRLLEHASNLSHKDIREENFAKFLFRLKTDETAAILRAHLASKDISHESIELAFQIVEKCDLSGLFDVLIDYMAKDELPLRVRKNASYCLSNMGLGFEGQVLEDLKSFDLQNDTDDDLRGNILRCLWPKHLNAEELLERITPIRQKNYSGSYAIFLEYELPQSLELFVTDDLANVVLGWANSHLLRDEFSRMGGLARKIYSCYWRSLGRLSKDVANLLLDGYMLTMKEFSNPFAIREYSEVAEPALSYEEFKKDKDTRLLILQMIVEDSNYDLSSLPNAAVTRYPLYTEDDFVEVLEFVEKATDPIQEARWFSCLNPILRLEQAKLHSDSLDRLHRAKPALIEPAETVITELATLRAKHDTQSKKWEKEREEHERKAEDSQKDIDSQIKAALASDNIPANYFRGISNSLCTSNGKYERESVDLTKSSGWSKLDTTERDTLIDLAEKYIREGDIPKTELNSFNLSAAYALHLLYSQRTEVFQHLGHDVWSRVASEVIKVSDFGKGECMDALLNALSESATDLASDTLLKQTVAEIESGVCSSLQRWGSRLTSSQAHQLLALCTDGDISIRGKYTLLTQVAKTSQQELCEDFLKSSLDRGNASPPAADMNLNLSLAFKLMPDRYGPAIIGWLENEPEWGKQWVTNIVGSWGSPLSAGVFACPIELIGRYYIWLHHNYPKSTCPEHDGAYTPNALDNIDQLKTHLINRIIDCGQIGSSSALQGIYSEFPEDEWLRNCIILAHQAECSSSLTSMSIDEIRDLVENGSRKRIIHSPKDLLESVIGWLDGYQEYLVGDNPAIGDLWHTQALISPKDEEGLSDHLARYLKMKSPSDLLINREVQIRRKLFKEGEPGARTDLWIQAVNPDTKETITLCIEVKCSWNGSSKTAMENQLLKKYLTGGTATAGILLLGWYSCASWNKKDSRQAASKRNWPDLNAAATELDQQANAISTPYIPIAAKVINCSLK